MQDPITIFQAVFATCETSEKLYSVALRKSGKFDIYYDGFKVYSANDNGTYYSFMILIERAVDVDLTYDTLYLKDKDGIVKAVNFENGARMSTEEAYKLHDFNFENIFYQRIKNSVKLFRGFCLIS